MLYDKANIPMLPNVAGIGRTKREIFGYSAALAAMSVALYPLHVLAVLLRRSPVLGGIFVYHAWRIFDDPGQRWPRGLFKYSPRYLALMCVAMVADPDRMIKIANG